MLPVPPGRGVCRVKPRYWQMGRSQSVFQRLFRLGGLWAGLLGGAYLRVATLALCFIAMGDVAYLQGSPHGEGSESRPDTGQQVDKVMYPPQDWGKYLKPSRGEILVPRGRIQAWERSPSGFFLTKGEQVAEFEKDLRLRVLDTRKLASIFSDERYYLKVEPADSKNSTGNAAICLEISCWVFQGQWDVKMPENLIPPNLEVTDKDPEVTDKDP